MIDLFSTKHLWVLLSVAVTFLISYRLYPVIIFISQKKRLMESPGERNSHTTETPSLGGVGLFVSFSLSLILFGMMFDLSQLDLIKLLSVIGASIILLFLGIKDDLIVLAPKQKFMGQLISSCIVIFMTDVRIHDFGGLLGIGELSYLMSVIFTLFVFILVVNAFNLVDGIDGLAGSLAIIASLSFGMFFAVNSEYFLMLVSFVLIGSLLGFLRYNLSENQKLFMGDSGSLFIGYLLAYQGISFLNMASSITTDIVNSPTILLAVLSFPLLDTLRVFAIRIKQKRSPFTADRNHIHHRLLDIGCSHKQASFAISLANILVIVVAFLTSSLSMHLQFGLVILVGVALYLNPFLIPLKPTTKNSKQDNPFKSLVDFEELNEQVRLRNVLIKNKLGKQFRFDEENGLLFIDEVEEPIDIYKEEVGNDLAKIRAWKLRRFVSNKKRQQEEYKS